MAAERELEEFIEDNAGDEDSWKTPRLTKAV